MISLSDLRIWLGSPPATAELNALLTALEARAVTIVEGETSRYFGAAAVFTDYRVGDGRLTLELRENPAAITSVHYRYQVGDTWTEILEADADGFELRAPDQTEGRARLLRKGGGGWPNGYELRVIYPFGYTSGAEPADIRQLVLDLVAWRYRERGREGLQSETLGKHSYTVLTAGMERGLTMLPGAAATIRRWRGTVRA